MLETQWSLSYGGSPVITFGSASDPIFNRTTPSLGDVPVTSAVSDLPRSDGRVFGADFRGGREVSFSLGIKAPTEEEARAHLAALTTAWRADPIRRTPGAVAELSARYRGQERRFYGRPRRFAADTSAAFTGYITVEMDFDTSDEGIYSLTVGSELVPIAPPSPGGLSAPLTSPLTTTANADRSVIVTVGGDVPTWPVISIKGPITNPRVSIAGGAAFGLLRTLAYDETVTIDTRPWHRTALRSGGAGSGSVAGAFTRASSRMANAGLAPGRHEITFTGIDPTGTATATIRWSDNHSTL